MSEPWFILDELGGARSLPKASRVAHECCIMLHVLHTSVASSFTCCARVLHHASRVAHECCIMLHVLHTSVASSFTCCTRVLHQASRVAHECCIKLHVLRTSVTRTCQQSAASADNHPPTCARHSPWPIRSGISSVVLWPYSQSKKRVGIF